MAGVVGANGMMVGPGGAAGPLSAEALHAVLLHTFTPDATQRKVGCGAPLVFDVFLPHYGSEWFHA